MLSDFDDRLDLLAKTYSDHRHLKLLRHCTIMAEELDTGTLAASLEERDAAETIVTWIHRHYDNEETNRDYRVALRVFGKRVTDGDECPPSIEWVPSGTDTVGQNDVTVGRSAAAVSDSDGREFAIDIVLISPTV